MRPLTSLFRRSQIEKELEEELRSHVAHRADDLERSGFSRAEAEYRARLEFGGHARFKEECQDALGSVTETLVQDVRFSLRLLRKSPSFSVAAVLTLALAIGANAVVFGVLNGVVLRPLSVPRAETLWGTEYGSNPEWQSYPNYRDLRERNHSFEDLAAFTFAFVGLDTGKNASLATGYGTSGNYFDILQIRPYLGRFFHSSDEHGPDSAPYLVLSYAYWHSHFLDDRSIVGKTVALNKHPFTIIGVTPPEFRGTLLFVSPDFFLPVINQELLGGGKIALTERGKTDTLFEVFGHLKPGVSPEQARADVDHVGTALERIYPDKLVHKPTALSRSGLTSFGGPAKAFLAALMLLAALILLAACANLGGLFAARAADRAREVALRLALGASRKRILRGLLTEAVLLALAGGALGLLSSVALLRQLSTWQPFAGAPIHLPVSPDASVYVLALLLALGSGFLFGLVPIRQVLRSDPYEIVKAGSRTTKGRRVTAREVLLAGQIAICAVLITSSLVAVRGLARSLHERFGFEPRHTMCTGVNLAMAGYSGEGARDMQKRIVHAVEDIQGVAAAGLVNDYPPLVYLAAGRANIFGGESSDLRPSKFAARPFQYEVSPGYFRAAGTALMAGRSFSWHDDGSKPPVAVLNRYFAQMMFGSVPNSLGRYLKLQDGTRIQIVGVVEDGKYLSLTEDQEPALFLSSLQRRIGPGYLIVRSVAKWNDDEAQLASRVRTKLHELDPGLPVNTETWNSLLGVVQFPSHMATVSLGVLGILGSILSITGIFGMASYAVSKRRRELGIRLALGAQRKEVLQTALGRAFKLLAFGSATGLIVGLLASRVLAAIVYEATPRDPLVLAGVVLAMLCLGLLATWVPAQRVFALDPSELLREE